MGVFRSDRWSAARNLMVGVLAYLVAATGMLGAVTRSAHGVDATGTVVLCTIDGFTAIHDDTQPGKPGHVSQHCMLCNVTADVTSPEPTTAGKAVEPPVAARAPGRSYDPILPSHAFAGWLGTRSPRAPPFAA
jgi:hypothetical protein